MRPPTSIGVLVLLPFHVGPARDRADHAGRVAAIVGEVKEGWRVVVTRPALKGLLLLAATVYVTWGAFVVVEPIYVREVLHGSPTLFALLQTAFGVGLVATGVAVTRLGDRLVRWSVVCAAAVGSGVAAMLYVGTSTLVVAFVGLLVWGGVTGLLIAPMRTLMQRAAPVEAHGRVFAFDGMVHSLGDLVSLPLVGLAAGAVGVQFAGVVVGAIPIAGGLLMWRAIRRRQAAADPHFLDAVAEAAAA